MNANRWINAFTDVMLSKDLLALIFFGLFGLLIGVSAFPRIGTGVIGLALAGFGGWNAICRIRRKTYSYLVNLFFYYIYSVYYVFGGGIVIYAVLGKSISTVYTLFGFVIVLMVFLYLELTEEVRDR